ncbi:MAG: hypothetical protein EPO52_17450 [Herbiconiux sp.]|nr:MAG: hypothetical protein EPO52_17450 [Herbiconiux sp.]
MFPTLSTLTEISNDLSDARLSIAVQEVPAVADAPITQLLVMSLGLIAIVTDELATGLRAPAVAGIGPLAVLAIAPLVRRSEPNVSVYLLTAVAFLVLLWCSARIGTEHRFRWQARAGGRNPLLAVGLGVGALAALVALPTVTPGLTAESLADDGAGGRFPTVYATGVDPTIQLGRDLRRSDPVLSLTYSTTSEKGLYLKMVNLGEFTGDTWEPETPLGAVGYSGQDFGTPPGLAADVPVVESSTSISIQALRSDWLPLPYPTSRVDGLAGDWLLTPSTFTVTNLQGDTQGHDYEVESQLVQPTAEQLAAAGATVPDAIAPFLSVPSDLPAIISDTAAQVASGAATNYDQAVALQEYFRGGQFRYSLSAPEAGGYDGDNATMIAAFLEQKEGYCVHFASAMAVMARTLGIPSRIAIGYAPGQTADATTDGRPVYEVYTDQLHAWPELYFDGIGWLPFEPTPGLDITPPDYSLPDYAQSGSTGASAAPTPASTSTANPADRPDQPDQAVAQTPEQVTLAQVRGWGVFAAILGGAAAIVLLPFSVRRLRRRSRLRRLPEADAPATLAWTELEDTLDDYRAPRSAGDTLQAAERRLIDDLSLNEELVGRLRLDVEREQYAGGRASSPTSDRARVRDDLLALIAQLEARASTGERMRARLLPVSLLRRRRTSASAGSLVP